MSLKPKHTKSTLWHNNWHLFGNWCQVKKKFRMSYAFKLCQTKKIQIFFLKTPYILTYLYFLTYFLPQSFSVGQSEHLEKGVKKSAACGQKNELWQTGDCETSVSEAFQLNNIVYSQRKYDCIWCQKWPLLFFYLFMKKMNYPDSRYETVWKTVQLCVNIV